MSVKTCVRDIHLQVDSLDSDGVGVASRRRPPCEYFPRFGDCGMQHLGHVDQVALSDAGALGRARRNSRLNGLDVHCEFVLSDLYDRGCNRLTEAAYLQLDRGIVFEEVGIFDLFTHTAHVKTLGVFNRAW